MTRPPLGIRRGRALDVDLHASLAEVTRSDWRDSTPDEFFFSRPFLEVMRDSGVEKADYRIVLLRRGGRPAGAAVLTRFTLSLDLLSGDPWIRRLRRWVPDLLDVPMVCCGIPASFGQHHLHVHDPRLREEAFRCVDEVAEDWARETGTDLVLWKEWTPEQGLRRIARERGYVVLPTLPDHRVGPLPATISQFVRALRSPYRRKYRTALCLVDHGRYGDIHLRLEPFDGAHVTAFLRGYEAVMDRTAVRLERYPRAFFEALAESELPASLMTLHNEREDQSLSALLLPSGADLCFLLVAKEASRYSASLYSHLLRCIVLRAVQQQHRYARLGQTSAYSKLSVGAEPVLLETFMRLRTPWKHRLLARFGHHLFPEVPSPRLRVFRTSPLTPDSPARNRP